MMPPWADGHFHEKAKYLRGFGLLEWVVVLSEAKLEVSAGLWAEPHSEREAAKGVQAMVGNHRRADLQ